MRDTDGDSDANGVIILFGDGCQAINSAAPKAVRLMRHPCHFVSQHREKQFFMFSLVLQFSKKVSYFFLRSSPVISKRYPFSSSVTFTLQHCFSIPFTSFLFNILLFVYYRTVGVKILLQEIFYRIHCPLINPAPKSLPFPFTRYEPRILKLLEVM